MYCYQNALEIAFIRVSGIEEPFSFLTFILLSLYGFLPFAIHNRCIQATWYNHRRRVFAQRWCCHCHLLCALGSDAVRSRRKLNWLVVSLINNVKCVCVHVTKLYFSGRVCMFVCVFVCVYVTDYNTS